MEFTPAEDAILLLLLAGDASRIKGATRLQKLVFLLSRQPAQEELREDLDYLALTYGPYSEVLDDTLDMMAGGGFVKVEGHRPRIASLTEVGLRAALSLSEERGDFFRAASELKFVLNDIPQKDLLALVYQLYPEMAKESALADVTSPNVEAIHLGLDELKEDNGAVRLKSSKDRFYQVRREGEQIVITED